MNQAAKRNIERFPEIMDAFVAMRGFRMSSVGVLQRLDVGYEVLDFDQEVAVGAGTNFAIAVKLTTPDYAYPIAVMCNAYFQDGSPYLERVVPMPGVSYFGAGETTAGAEWEEMSGDGDFFCKILGSRNLRDWAIRSDADLFFKVSVSPK